MPSAAARGARDAPTSRPSWSSGASFRQLVELEHAQPAVRVAAVVQPRDRLLARVAALREGDVRRVEARLGREDPVVDLVTPARHARSRSGAARARRRRASARARRRAPRARRASRSRSRPRRRRRAPTRAPPARSRTARAKRIRSELRAHGVAEPRLGQDAGSRPRRAAQHDERRDHPRLRGQQQRRARLADRERLDVVRDHPLQVVGRVRPGARGRTPALSQLRPCV